MKSRQIEKVKGTGRVKLVAGAHSGFVTPLGAGNSISKMLGALEVEGDRENDSATGK